MILFQTQKEFKQKFVKIFSIRLQANICIKLSCSSGIPLTLELGLGLITFSYEIWQVLKK